MSRVVLNPQVILSLSIENKLFLLFSETQFVICIQAINTQSACSKLRLLLLHRNAKLLHVKSLQHGQQGGVCYMEVHVLAV